MRISPNSYRLKTHPIPIPPSRYGLQCWRLVFETALLTASDCSNFQLVPRVITQEEAFQHFSYLYVRYLQVLRKLDDCYDQMVHPQKRRDLRIALDTVMARVVQVGPVFPGLAAARV